MFVITGHAQIIKHFHTSMVHGCSTALPGQPNKNQTILVKGGIAWAWLNMKFGTMQLVSMLTMEKRNTVELQLIVLYGTSVEVKVFNTLHVIFIALVVH